MRTLFLFLPALGLAMDFPHAPGMYPPEETGSASGTVPPSPYGSEPEAPYLFYYEKDPAPPGSSSGGHSPGQRGPGREGTSSDKSGSSTTAGDHGRGSGPVPPGGHGEAAPESYYDSTTGGRHPGSSSSHHGGVDPNNPYGQGETTSQAHGKATHRPSNGPKEEENGDGVDPIDPYEHGKDGKYSGKKGTVKGGSTATLTEPSEHWHSLTHMHFGDPSSPDNTETTDTSPTVGSSTSEGADGDTTHNPSSFSNEELSPDKSVFPTNTHETKDGEDSGERLREDITGGKGYRADKDFEVNGNFKGGESLSLTGSGENLGKSVPNDLLEVDKEIDKLQKLPVHREQEEVFKSTTGRTPGTFQPCCACCKEEIKVRQPVIGGGYIEASSSQVVPGPFARPSSPPLDPGVIAGETGGYPIAAGQSAGYSQNPLQSYFSPAQSPAYLGSYGGGGCGCAPQICCRPVQPCCLPTLPCCPPPPPIPCCPQISICCQPIVLPQPCCITLPQICLPTIPLCFRGCPSCPCRRRRSIDDPRHHGRVKRQSCMRRRAKRQSNCRQCNGLNSVTQPSGGCGTCNGSHRRVKRLGCLPCGRKKREAEQENEHIRQKRSCLPCLNGRKKRQAPAGSCTKCSLLQTFITRHKRSISCGPCGRKKRSPSSCSCSSSSNSATSARMKRAVISNFDDKDQCDRSCCDYSKCGELRARKLDLKN